MRPTVKAPNGVSVPSTYLLARCAITSAFSCTPPEPAPTPPPQPGPDDRRRSGPVWDVATMTATANVTVAGVVYQAQLSAVLHPDIDRSKVAPVQTLFGRGFRYVETLNIPSDEPWVTLTITLPATIGIDITNYSVNRDFPYVVQTAPYEWQGRGAPVDATTFMVSGGGASSSPRPTRLPAGTQVIQIFEGSAAATGGSNVAFGLWDLTE